MLSSLLSGSPKLVEVRIAILDTKTFCLIRCVVFSRSYTFWITICWNFLASSKGKKIIFLEKEEEKTFFIRMCTKRIKYTLKSRKRHFFPLDSVVKNPTNKFFHSYRPSLRNANNVILNSFLHHWGCRNYSPYLPCKNELGWGIREIFQKYFW